MTPARLLSKSVIDMTRAETEISSGEKDKRKTIKCLIWDLDHTLWDGILLEDESVSLRPQVVEIIQTLDSRGILQSIASRNDHDKAVGKASGIRPSRILSVPADQLEFESVISKKNR